MRAAEIVDDEFIAPDSVLAHMLAWRGWWRFMWRWNDRGAGLHLDSLRMILAHRKYCDAKCWDKIGFCVRVWRLSFCFSCETIDESRARDREMFASDIWPTVVLEDILDAEEIGG